MDADDSLLTVSWKESSNLPAITNLSGGDEVESTALPLPAPGPNQL